MASAQQEKNGTWTGRARHCGRNRSESGFDSKKAAKEWARGVEDEWKTVGQPKGVGPSRMTVVRALLEMALICLPYKKGARQEAARMNEYLRLAGNLPLLWIEELSVTKREGGAASDEAGKDEKSKLIHCSVETITIEEYDKRCKGAKGFMARSDPKSASMRCRARIGAMKFSDLRSSDIQDLIEERKKEGLSAAAIGHDVAILRELYNNARKRWYWLPNSTNPASKENLIVPSVDNARARLLTPDQEERLVVAMDECYDPRKLHAIAFLCSSAMRCAEALKTIRWKDIGWETGLIYLSDQKSGGDCHVPVTNDTLAILRLLPRGADDEPIFGFTYNALKSSFSRACMRARIEDFNLHDLRHVALTSLSLRLNGYIGALQKISRHKTREQLERYEHISAENTRALLIGQEPVKPGERLLQMVINNDADQALPIEDQMQKRRAAAQEKVKARKTVLATSAEAANRSPDVTHEQIPTRSPDSNDVTVAKGIEAASKQVASAENEAELAPVSQGAADAVEERDHIPLAPATNIEDRPTDLQNGETVQVASEAGHPANINEGAEREEAPPPDEVEAPLPSNVISFAAYRRKVA